MRTCTAAPDSQITKPLSMNVGTWPRGLTDKISGLLCSSVTGDWPISASASLPMS